MQLAGKMRVAHAISRNNVVWGEQNLVLSWTNLEISVMLCPRNWWKNIIPLPKVACNYGCMGAVIQGQGIIDPSRYTVRGMGADKLQENIKLYLRLQ